METGKTIAIVGLNASGKTQYIERLRRQLASDRVRYIAFCDSYGVATDRAYYLQLRWNQHDIDEETPTVGSKLEQVFLQTGKDTAERRIYQQHLYHMFAMEKELDKYLILLSSGELRKYQLVKHLLSHPSILILDNPFIGLDAASRILLRDLLVTLVREEHLTVYLLLSKPEDIPSYTDEIIYMTPEDSFFAEPQGLSIESKKLLLNLPPSAHTSMSEEIIRMNDVCIRYGKRQILNNLNWIINEGEHWSLSGPNGCGKSTLLSLISADNPQAYACDISLFGNQRGSGETIWEIKSRIGYVSPEMHRSYQRNLPSLQVVASGIKDTIGLYVRPNATEREKCLWWMRLFGIEDLASRSFMEISSGEQRMVLLARALVKDPELLILDEPMHGLDLHRQKLVKDIIETFCKRPHKTLIFVTHYLGELPSCIDHHLTLSKTQ